jgi:hypothetical protein
MNLGHRLNMVVTKDYHKLWLVCFLFLLRNVEIHVLEEEVVLILCSQITCIVDKYLIKRYVISLIFTQYVLCENARLVSAMILFGSSKMVSRFFEVSRTPNVNSFF